MYSGPSTYKHPQKDQALDRWRVLRVLLSRVKHPFPAAVHLALRVVDHLFILPDTYAQHPVRPHMTWSEHITAGDVQRATCLTLKAKHACLEQGWRDCAESSTAAMSGHQTPATASWSCLQRPPVSGCLGPFHRLRHHKTLHCAQERATQPQYEPGTRENRWLQLIWKKEHRLCLDRSGSTNMS